MIVCPSCGQENPDGFRLCGMCGAPLGEEREAPREERKVVTVLFADLVGFTSRAEKLDPEEVRALQAPYWARLRSELERYGGTVEKFIGDAVMALFGAPTAHEDDPERAVRAALAIRDWAREEGELEVRIGITSGEALVSLGARPEAGEGMASGDVVNTASRLQAAAPANGILVDETTYRATPHTIDYREVDPVEAKGKQEPVPVWEAVQARAVVGVELRPKTPLVGRERERDLLVAELERIRRESSSQLVTLVGVPGIGKSRLVAELFAEVERDPDLIFWRQGRSLPYGEGVAFWAFAEMVKAQAGILETDTAEAAAQKLHDAVATVLGDDDTAWVEQRLQPLVGIGEGGGDRDESFTAWRRFVEGLAELRATVLVFEDLHWADDDLLDFVDHLVDWATGVPLLVVGTARPELLDRRPGWGGGKRNALTISLAPLANDETARLIASLLDRPVLSAETQEALLARAGGNPLYAEQFVRMLAERGDPGVLPETVQGIIAARLDALPPEEKARLQDASVIGRVFWVGALEQISGVERRDAEQRLHALERKEFVRRERRSSVARETEHAFAHLLVRDVAYSQIPRATRAEKHRKAAEWLESLSAERSEDRAEMLAHHYLSALEYVAAAGGESDELRERARLALRDAADRAFALSSFGSAIRLYGQALELWPSDDPNRLFVLLRRGQAEVAQGTAEGVESLLEAADGFLAAGDAENAAEASMLAAHIYWDQGARDAADEQAERAHALVRDLGPSPAKAGVLVGLSRLLMLGPTDLPRSIRLGREGLAMAESLGLKRRVAAALITVGTSRSQLGETEGVEEIQRGLEVALEAKVPVEITRALNNLGEVALSEGDLPEVRRLYGEARRLLREFGRNDAPWVDASEGWLFYQLGEWDAALSLLDPFLARVEAGESNYLESHARMVRASIRYARGDVGGGLAEMEEAVAAARLAKDPQTLGPVLATRAMLLVQEGRQAEAVPLVGEVANFKNQEGGFAYFTWLPELAWLMRDLGRTDEFLALADPERNLPSVWTEAGVAIASGDLAGAAERFAAMGARTYEAYARLSSGIEAQVRRALEFYRSVGATRYVQEGEAMLAATA